MSTRAVIAIKQPNGTINLARLQRDGYPGHAGAILAGWYKTAEQVEALLALGEIRELGTTPETSEAYDGGLPGYVRDEGMLIRNFDMTDYIYLFDNGKWRFLHRQAKELEWIELEVKVGNE